MIKIIPAALFFLSFFASLISNAILRRLSIQNNFLIDSPNDQTKLHQKGTPATGGIAISIGIIFSGLFLFAFTDSEYDLDISTDKFISGSEFEKTINESSLKMTLDNNVEVEIERFDDSSFTITLPSGEKRLYRIYVDQNSLKNDSYMVLEKGSANQIRITNFSIGLFFFTLLVQLVMVLDDLWGLKPLTKLFLQTVCVGGLIFVSDMYINSLGDLFGHGDIVLGLYGIPFTIFCVVGIMNAFNMIDGINGLCASMCLICFVAIIYVINADSIPSLFPLILPVGSIVGFLMYNLGILGDRTVFLGDNGSNSLGFLCAWVLIYFSNIENAVISPVTALWLVAIPFVDAVGVIFSRILNKLKVLNSYRDHIHHKMLSKGFSEELVFSILVLLSGLLAFIGLYFNKNFPDQSFYSFYAFIVFWLCYYLIVKRLSDNV